jgi:hypothetical protein
MSRAELVRMVKEGRPLREVEDAFYGPSLIKDHGMTPEEFGLFRGYLTSRGVHERYLERMDQVFKL